MAVEEDHRGVTTYTCDTCNHYVAAAHPGLHFLPPGWVQLRVGSGRMGGTVVRLYCTGGCYTAETVSRMLEEVS